MKKLLFVLSILIGLLSCNGDGSKSHLASSMGNPYEIVVMANDTVQTGEAFATLREIMSEEVPMIQKIEPQYDLVTSLPTNVKSIMLRHRNIIVMSLNPQYDSASVKLEYNKHADPQMMVYMTAPDDKSLADYLKTHKNSVLELFNRAERDRMVKKIVKYSDRALIDTVKNMFDFTMYIPEGYKVRNATDNFLWISYETPHSSQGMFIYTYPYEEGEKFRQSYALELRDLYASKIPGALDGSYMKTSDYLYPTIKTVKINGTDWIEQRGLWDVKNDFMGGPFVSYSTIQRDKSRVLVIDQYLYQPFQERDSRNLIHQLNNIVYTVKFDKSK